MPRARKSAPANAPSLAELQRLIADLMPAAKGSLNLVRHPETGQRLIGQPVALRNRYLERLNRHLAQVTDYAKRAQADYVRITNSDDLTKLMSLHFLRRLMWRTR